jgi:hypothetical protein
MVRVRALECSLGLLLLAAPAAGAQIPRRSEIACIDAVHAAAARVGAAVAERFVRCVRGAVRNRLPGGQMAEQCLVADPGKRVARATAKTGAVFARRCHTTPPLGPQSADTVNDALGRLLPVRSVFGPSLDAAVAAGAGDARTARCQMALAGGMKRLALASVASFRTCTRRGLTRGTITAAADLQRCVGADVGRRIARARRATERRVRRACGAVALATAAPGDCRSSSARDLVECCAGHVQCRACVTLDAADDLAAACTPFVDGVAMFSCADPPATTVSVARQWDEEALAAIRRDNPRPPVHARNLFHLSVAMYDAWAAYDPVARPVLARERATSPDPERDRAIALSFAAYRVLSERYAAALALGADRSQADFAHRMTTLGLDPGFTDTGGPSPAALGNRVAAAVLAHGRTDGSNEEANYADPTYEPVNAPLVVKVPDIDFLGVRDPNRWQPLALDVMIGQNGVPLPGKVQSFVGSHWGQVTPFALTRDTPTSLYLDPGPQPHLGGAGDAEFRAQVRQVIELSSQLTPDDPTTIDISPASYGNNTVGSNDGHGYAINPVTGEPYASRLVKRGDFGRVIAEYWADGPNSETPPGHWNVLANSVSDTPGFERRLGGAGPVLGPLEWDVKTYLAVNGALHDAAVACWGAKRAYDSVRPITMIRFMGKKGQSSDAGQASFDPMGLALEPGLIEVITPESSAPGQRHADLITPDAGGRVGEVAIRAWPRGPQDPASQHSGVRWVLARGWVPYQRDTFVTPAFPGYFSGHSTFSRAAAEVLALLTGSQYFPGGLGEFVAPRNDFLRFEIGPSEDVPLQWARYVDAADQAGQSRLWGGIHVQADDFTGRTRGRLIGLAAFEMARRHFDGTSP